MLVFVSLIVVVFCFWYVSLFLVYFIDLFVDFCDGCCSKWWTWYAGWSRDWGESFVAPPSSANLISPQDQTLKRKRMFFKVFFSSCMQSNLKTFPKTFLTYPLVLPVLRKHSYRLDNWSSHFYDNLSPPKEPIAISIPKISHEKGFSTETIHLVWSGPELNWSHCQLGTTTPGDHSFYVPWLQKYTLSAILASLILSLLHFSIS